MEQDMRLAAEIQRGLLPERAPALPGWSLAGFNTPSRAVGGDYYDYALEEGHVLIALGDVAGKGTGAALLMAVLRAAVRAHWAEAHPSTAVEKINRTVCQNVPEGRYVTFFMARLDPATGRFAYVNAGHIPPIVARAGGDVVRLEDGGCVLGMFETLPYEAGAVTLEPGDAFAVFSDGISEATSPDGEEYGEDRIAAVLRAHPTAGAEELQDHILRDVGTFSAGAHPSDDRTLVVLRRLH
jgi:sigma-B regulation protein RsbU (phosphoserine phosphatase)